MLYVEKNKLQKNKLITKVTNYE